MYTGFVCGLKAGAEFAEGDDKALQACYETMRGVDYSAIFGERPELDSEVILNCPTKNPDQN